ncbi:hypothetical protein [Winogradskyella sp.]|uniref:hypothetical protein n=1 Tax=Winogradskyella sp. TaxID=1883156 RepID=UPI00261BC0CC|nr:hypothetical protein [Winogradskyella sp.]
MQILDPHIIQHKKIQTISTGRGIEVKAIEQAVNCSMDNEIDVLTYSDPKFRNDDRKEDLNIFHYDYNLLLISNYNKYNDSGKKMTNTQTDPFFSFCFKSPVLGSIVAMIKEINNDNPT